MLLANDDHVQVQQGVSDSKSYGAPSSTEGDKAVQQAARWVEADAATDCATCEALH